MKPFLTLLLSSYLFMACGQKPPADTFGIPAPHHPSNYTWKDALDAHLKTIQSMADSEQVGFEVYDIATTWAAAGYIEPANRLLSDFWKYKITGQDNFRYANEGFSVLWAISGKRPGYIPFAPGNINEIVQDNWDDLFYPNLWLPEYKEKIEHKPWTTLDNPLLSGKAAMLSFNADAPTHRSSGAMTEQAVQAYKKSMAQEDKEGFYASTATEAAIVAAGAGKAEEATAFIRYWAKGLFDISGLYRVESMMRDTAVARLLLTGVLANDWGMTQASCDTELQRVEAVLDKRVKSGPSLVYGQLSLKALLQRMSDGAIRSKEVDYSDIVLRTHWLGYPPANAAQIQAAEKRLGLTLPEDYKTFLLLTNGFRSTGYIDVNYLPVEKIGWLRDMDPQLVELWGKPMAPGDTARANAFKRSILIGGDEEEQQLLLIPPAGKDKSWQCWYFSVSITGETVYPSLRFYLENRLQEEEDWGKQERPAAPKK